jgi:valyl-tRNA synthetase
MDKVYNPKDHEDEIYAQWEESGLFNPDNLPGDRTEPFAVMMPPPNVTGVLHLGHALENTIMDIGVRYHRMNEKKAVLVPGTDHAAVATQAKVEGMLMKDGMKNPRAELGRDGLLEKIREFAEDSKATILNQVRKMGTSADWSRLAYTFDEDRSRAVNEMFVRMYNDGLIYRGHRVVNWSVKGQSTASDDEIEHEERKTTLYTFRYSKDFPIPIATVLPETKLGDTAVAVHPEDERYKEYIGQTFTVDVGAAEPLSIDVIADEEVDPEYGTGALGVTPAHSTTDFEMYQRNKEIGLIQVIGSDGKITQAGGQAYAGLPVKEAREKFVEWLRAEELMISEEEITHNISLSDRFKDEIWPMPMEQWFIDVNRDIPGRGKSLKGLMMDAVTTGHGGDASKKVTILPAQFEKVYKNWIENLHDWNISRQIWWGHRIPVWYRGEEIYCGVQAPDGDGWTQDEDTLDTWFSSGTWSFSTLGWPAATDDLQTFHPTGWMQMGHEILRLWMARMIMMSTYALDEIPFKDVYIHGILRDKHGKKFSKSSGNGIDPLDVIKEHGTDALRFSLIKGIAPGADSRFYMDKVKDAQHFVNKLWNITRYVLSQEGSTQELSVSDRWIQSHAQTLVQEVTADLDVFRFSQAAEKIYEFLWHDFADWYIEMSKAQPNPQVARNTLATVLKLAHPIMPFVTEALWKELGQDGVLLVAPWPKAEDELRDAEATERVGQLRELIGSIRNVRAEYKIDPGTMLEVIAFECTPDEQHIIEKLARVTFVEEKDFTNAATVVAGKWSVTMPLDGVIDVEEEKKRLQKEIDALTGHTAGLEKKLSNTQYTQNAPAEVVEETRAQLKTQTEKIEQLRASLKSFG